MDFVSPVLSLYQPMKYHEISRDLVDYFMEWRHTVH